MSVGPTAGTRPSSERNQQLGSAGVLTGVRVVDFSTGIAGGYCTKLLADAGADVVKVEGPGGDPLRAWKSGALFEFLNTSKRSIIGTPNDDEMLDLAARADIVIESGAPGSFPVDTLLSRRPDLVIASITPLGQDGPWANWGATEFTLQAWCGSTGSRGVPERPPVAAGGRIGEWVTGTYAPESSAPRQCWIHGIWSSIECSRSWS